MKPLPVKPGDMKHILDNLQRVTGRSRDECAAAFTLTGNRFHPTVALLKAEAKPVAPAQEARPRYTPPPSAFPQPIPAVRVDLPGDGSPQAIRAYWQAWEADYARRCADRAEAKRQAELATQRRAREVCGRMAALVANKT